MSIYKFTLPDDLVEYCELLEGINFTNEWFTIANGHITVKKGYSWNGCNCAIDTKSTYVASCIHDNLYQFKAVPRTMADNVFNYFLERDGFCLRGIYYFFVRCFGWWFY